MTPMSPVVPGQPEVIYAKDQPEYLPLPAYRLPDDLAGTILTRWRCSWRERLRVLWTGDVYLYVMTFGRPLQPVMVTVRPVEENA